MKTRRIGKAPLQGWLCFLLLLVFFLSAVSITQPLSLIHISTRGRTGRSPVRKSALHRVLMLFWGRDVQ